MSFAKVGVSHSLLAGMPESVDRRIGQKPLEVPMPWTPIAHILR